MPLVCGVLLCGCGHTAALPSHPTVTVISVVPGTTTVTAPGVVSAPVECGGEVQVHPTGPLPWEVRVRTGGGAFLRVSVAQSPSTVWLTRDRRTGQTVLAVQQAGGGPGPVCPGGA